MRKSVKAAGFLCMWQTARRRRAVLKISSCAMSALPITGWWPKRGCGRSMKWSENFSSRGVLWNQTSIWHQKQESGQE